MVTHPLARQSVSMHLEQGDKEVDHFVFEGEAQMSQQQQDAYKGLIGDGAAKITVAKDLGEKNFGNGGSVMVSITLTCDQSHAAINGAVDMAHGLADYWIKQYHDQMRRM